MIYSSTNNSYDVITTPNYRLIERSNRIYLKDLKSLKEIPISKDDLRLFIKFVDFSDLIDNYLDNEIDSLLDKFFKMKVFL